MDTSETAGNDPEKTDPTERSDAEVEAGELRSDETEQLARRFRGTARHGAAERERMIKQAREIQFPVALRGYARGAVDQYVQEVNRLIAELEMTSSPESAVRHALEELSEETRELLQRAHQTADEITGRARLSADERLDEAERQAQALREAAQREVDGLRQAASREAQELRAAAQREGEQLREAARREAEELRAGANREADHILEVAERRAQELTLNAEAIWRERRRLIEDVRTAGEQLVALGEAEARRFTKPAGSREETER